MDQAIQVVVARLLGHFEVPVIDRTRMMFRPDPGRDNFPPCPKQAATTSPIEIEKLVSCS